MTTPHLPVSVAAGNPVTAEVGAEILQLGGSAADAAVAMVLASCVAETLFTGLAGGGYATYFDAASGGTHCLDFFVAVPGLGGRRSVAAREIAIDFGGQLVPYAVGASTVAVPGVPAGISAIYERWGRLPWRDLVAPAQARASKGVAFAPLHAKLLARVAPAMLINEGVQAYSGADGNILAGGATLFHPGLDTALESLARDGAAAFYTGEIAQAMVAAVGEQGDLSTTDLAAYRVRESPPQSARLDGLEVLARGDDLDDLLRTVESVVLPDDPAELAVELVRALRGEPRRGDTTSLAAADSAGNACAVTTSLGLSSGVWLPDLGIHLNSMMGEGELLRGDEVPGERLGSMMSPLLVLDDGRPVLVGGAAGGSRIRSALLQILVNVVRLKMDVADAIRAPRLNPVPGRVHVEPGFPASTLARLSEDDQVVPWASLDTYFGGAAAIGVTGPGADPRRGGDVRLVETRV